MEAKRFAHYGKVGGGTTQSRSINSQSALTVGRKPMSMFGKDDLEELQETLPEVKTIAQMKKLLQNKWSGEWHHTGIMATQTPHYSLNDIIDYVKNDEQKKQQMLADVGIKYEPKTVKEKEFGEIFGNKYMFNNYGEFVKYEKDTYSGRIHVQENFGKISEEDAFYKIYRGYAQAFEEISGLSKKEFFDTYGQNSETLKKLELAITNVNKEREKNKKLEEQKIIERKKAFAEFKSPYKENDIKVEDDVLTEKGKGKVIEISDSKIFNKKFVRVHLESGEAVSFNSVNVKKVGSSNGETGNTKPNSSGEQQPYDKSNGKYQ